MQFLQSFHITPEDSEFFAISNEWAKNTFSSGPIPVTVLEEVTTDLVYKTFLLDFQKTAKRHVERHKIMPLDQNWWEGLEAFSKVYSREITSGVGKHARAGKVDFATWSRFVFANERGLVGPLRGGLDLLEDWREDGAFANAWAAAVNGRMMNPRILEMFALALRWDTFTIPLRYFSDSAALIFLRAIEAPQFHLEMDSYRKDVRGNRKGLGLRVPEPQDVVVKHADEVPGIFYVDLANVRKHGLTIGGFKVPMENGRKPLVFKVRA